MAPRTPVANATSPKQLADLNLLSQTVELTSTALANLTEYRAIQLDGTYPSGTTDKPHGVIQYLSEDRADQVYATIICVGNAIVEVEPASTIAVGGQVAINSSGKAVAASTGDYVLGIALNSSTGSTVQAPHWIVVQVAGGYKI